MGGFLAMSGVIGAEKASVERALESFVTLHNGSFRRVARTVEDANTLVLLEDAGRCSVVYPWGFFDWDEASRHLSAFLEAPVFSLHIHDGDLWMFVVFDNGNQVAQFNPLPEYWSDDISDEERELWSGDAERIAACVPG